MPHVSASRLLLAPREDVWDFIAEPHHFPDWWPGIAGVQPDRRGVAEGARWEILGHDRPTLFRRATSSAQMLVRGVPRPERFARTLTAHHVAPALRTARPRP